MTLGIQNAVTCNLPNSPPFTVEEFAALVSVALNPPRPPPSPAMSNWSPFPDLRLLRMENDIGVIKQRRPSIPEAKPWNAPQGRRAFETERVDSGSASRGYRTGIGVASGGIEDEEIGKLHKIISASASSLAMVSSIRRVAITADPVSINSIGPRRPLDQKSFISNPVPNTSPGVIPHFSGSPSRPRSRSTNSGIPSVLVTPPPLHSKPHPHPQGQEQARRRSTITFAPLPRPSNSPNLLPLPLSESVLRSNSTSRPSVPSFSETTNRRKDPMILFAPPPVLSNNSKNENIPSASTPTHPYPTPIISATMSTVDLGINCLTSLNVAVGGSPNVSVNPSAYGSGSTVLEKPKSRSKSKSKSRSVSRSRVKEKKKEKEKNPVAGSASLSPSPSPFRGRSASTSASGPYNTLLSGSSQPSPSKSSRLSAPPSASPAQFLSPPGSTSGSNPLALRVFAKIKKQLSRNSINVNILSANAHDMSSVSCPNTPISGIFNTNTGATTNKNEDPESPLPLEYRYEYEFDFPYEFGSTSRSSASATGTATTANGLSPPQTHVRERARSLVSCTTSASSSTSVSGSPVGKGGRGKARYPTTNTDLGFTSFAALSAGSNPAVGNAASSAATGTTVQDKKTIQLSDEEAEDASMSTSRGGPKRGRTGMGFPISSDEDEGHYYSSSASPKPDPVPPFPASPPSFSSSASSYSCESAPFSFSFFPPPAGVSTVPPHEPAPSHKEGEEDFFSGHPYAHPELRSSSSDSSDSSPSLRSGASMFDVKFNNDADGFGSRSLSSSAGSSANSEGRQEGMEGHDSDGTSFIGSSCSFFVRMRARTSAPRLGVLGVGGPSRRTASKVQKEVEIPQQHQEENAEEIRPYEPYVPLIIQLERERMREKEREREREKEKKIRKKDSLCSTSASSLGTGSRSRSSTTPRPTPVVRTIPIPSDTAKGGLLVSEPHRSRTTSMRTGTGTARGSPPPPLLSPSGPNRFSASSDVSNVTVESEGPITPRTPVFVVVSEDVKEDEKSKNVVVQDLSPSNARNTPRSATPTPTYSPSVNTITPDASPPTSHDSGHRSRSKQSLVPNETLPPVGPLPLIPRSSLENTTKPAIPSRRGRASSPPIPNTSSDTQPPTPDEDEPEHRLSTSSTNSSCVLGSIGSSSSSSCLSSSSSPVSGHESRPRFPSSPLSFSSFSDSDNSEVIYETPMQTPTLSVFPCASHDSAAAEAEAARVLVANTRANAISMGVLPSTGHIGVGRQIIRRGERSGGDWTLLLGAGEDKEKEKAVKRCASNIGGMMGGRLDTERMRTKSESALRSVARGAGGRTLAIPTVVIGGGTEDWTLSMNLPMPGSVGRMGIVKKKSALDFGRDLSSGEEITLTVPRVVSVGSGLEDAVADEEELARLELLDPNESDHPVREARMALRNTKSCGVLLSGVGDGPRLRGGRGATMTRISSASQLIGTSTMASSSSAMTAMSAHKTNSIGRSNSIGSRQTRKARRPALPLTTLLLLPSPRPNSTLRPSSMRSSNSNSSSASDPELTPTPTVESTSNSYPFPNAMEQNRIQTRTPTPDVQESSDSMCSVDYYSARSSFALEA